MRVTRGHEFSEIFNTPWYLCCINTLFDLSFDLWFMIHVPCMYCQITEVLDPRFNSNYEENMKVCTCNVNSRWYTLLKYDQFYGEFWGVSYLPAFNFSEPTYYFKLIKNYWPWHQKLNYPLIDRRAYYWLYAFVTYWWHADYRWNIRTIEKVAASITTITNYKQVHLITFVKHVSATKVSLHNPARTAQK